MRSGTPGSRAGAFGRWVASLGEPSEPAIAVYRSYRSTWERAARLVGRSDRSSVLDIGESFAGEPLWALVAEPPAPAEATVLVVAGLHAMEHVGVATAIALLERALAPESPWVRHRLVVVPVANPDGFLAVERGLAAGERRFWRKNARGVDLNRNFSAFWDGGYYLTRLLPGIYSAGAAPLSEPETQAIDRVLATWAPRFAVSLHAFGEYIFTPYAGSRAAPPDGERLLEIATEMAARQPARPYRVVQLGVRSRLFLARGAEIDHFYERGALSFLFEIGAGPRWSHPETWLVPYRWFTPPAPLLERDIANVLPAIEYLAEL